MLTCAKHITLVSWTTLHLTTTDQVFMDQQECIHTNLTALTRWPTTLSETELQSVPLTLSLMNDI